MRTIERFGPFDEGCGNCERPDLYAWLPPLSLEAVRFEAQTRFLHVYMICKACYDKGYRHFPDGHWGAPIILDDVLALWRKRHIG